MSAGGSVPAGLQLERTRLSWRRTTLAATAVALLSVSKAVIDGITPLRAVAIALAAAGWLAILAVAHRRIAALARLVTSPPASTPAILALLVGAYAIGCALLVRT